MIGLLNAKLNGTINAIPSKSYAHRISICNFLAGKNPNSGCKDFTSEYNDSHGKNLKFKSS